MDLKGDKRAVQSILIDGKTETGFVHRYEQNSSQRMFNSLKAVGLFWLLALICVPFPGLHFVAVPGFFILGFVFAFKAWKKVWLITGGEAACPQCHSPLQIPRALEKWPLKMVCTHCRHHMKIYPQ